MPLTAQARNWGKLRWQYDRGKSIVDVPRDGEKRATAHQRQNIVNSYQEKACVSGPAWVESDILSNIQLHIY